MVLDADLLASGKLEKQACVSAAGQGIRSYFSTALSVAMF